MVQKAVHSEASSPNSLGPKRDWPEVRGEECRPRSRASHTVVPWTWEPGGKGNCSFLRKWAEQKRKILLPALHQGKGWRCSRRLLRKKIPNSNISGLRQSPGCIFLVDLGPGWDAGGAAPARGSTRRPRYRFGLGQSSSRGRKRAPTATGRLRPGPGGTGGCCITPGQVCWITSVCCCTAENCWAKPSTVSPNSPAWEMGALRKCALSTSFISTRLSQRWRSWTTMVDIAFPRDRTVTFGARRVKSVVDLQPDAVIDILSTDGAPNDMLGAPWDRPAKSPGNRTGCSLREE